MINELNILVRRLCNAMPKSEVAEKLGVKAGCVYSWTSKVAVPRKYAATINELVAKYPGLPL